MRTHKSIKRNLVAAFTIAVAIFSQVQFAAAQTQDHCIRKYGPDSTETLKQISLYRELFGQRKYVEAYEHWRYVFANAPCLYERTHAEGRTILNAMIDGTKDKKRRGELIDTLMLMYDLRIRYFGKENYVKGFKGRDMIKYQPEKTEEGIKILIESVDGEGLASTEFVINDLASAYFNQWKEKKVSDDEMVTMYEKLSVIAEKNVERAKTEKEAENWNTTLTNVNSLFTPVLTCEKIVSIYKPKLDKNPEDTALMTRIIGYLQLKSCTKEPFYLAVAEKLYEAKPDATAARALGDAFSGEKNFNKASFYYSRAIGMEGDPIKKSQDYISIAKIHYDRKNCQEARSNAMQAILLNPNAGEAYIIIGDAYVMCASQCSDAFEQKTIYWAAVDKYQKAKAVDPSVAARAQDRISTYSRYFPEKQECFFRGLTTEGASYILQCWPNETTTVRF